MKKTILITGGAGYIGSHIAYLFVQRGYRVVIIDNLVHHTTWHHSWATFIYGDCGNETLLRSVFLNYSIDAVVHCAAFIEVGRSVTEPAEFYDNNVVKIVTLLRIMREYNVSTFIFSSSCSVYGIPEKLPLTEDHPKNPISPYGNTKLMVEMILNDFAHAYNLKYVALRYFNAAGALPEQGLGEHHEPETHVIPLLLRAVHHHETFMIFGTDHPTPDGTCIRDYLHVVDIADAHVKALEYLDAGNPSHCFNLGTGKGVSVLELINIVEEQCRKKINKQHAPRRAGDPGVLVADPRLAQECLQWKTQRSNLAQIVADANEFFVRNCIPNEQLLFNSSNKKSLR